MRKMISRSSMRDICLLDVDSKIPNLALMRASTWHKQRGDSVKLGYEPLFDHPDYCYASKIFDFTPEPQFMPDCETLKGGTGYDLTARMPFEDYDRIMPDYSLYPQFDYALGRLTRGCPNRCPWCVVPKMDGNQVRHVADLSDFWQGQKNVRLLDDNIMSDADEFCRDCEQLSNAGVAVTFDALDIRCVDDQTAAALATLKHGKKSLHFAWDSHAQDDYIARGISILGRHGIKPYRLMFYVLVGFGTQKHYDLYRINLLHQLGANPFVMPFDKSDRYQKDLARWCNNKFIFKSTSFENYHRW